MDCYFIDLMVEQASGGNKVDEAFSEQAWAHMVTSFNDKFGLQCDKYFLENRYMFFMKQYNDISNLLNYSGFAWNESQQIVTAEDHIWEAYIKVHFLFDIVVYSLLKNHQTLIWLYIAKFSSWSFQLPQPLHKKRKERKKKKKEKNEGTKG